MAKKELLTVKQVAEQVGVTDRSIRSLVQRGRLTAEEERGANGTMLFAKSEVKRFISERKKAEKAKEQARKAKAAEKAKAEKKKAKKVAAKPEKKAVKKSKKTRGGK